MKPKAPNAPLELKLSGESAVAEPRAAGHAAQPLVETMLARLASPNKATQRDAVERLAVAAAAGDWRCAGALRRALSDPVPRVRWAAAYGLARIEDASGVDVLCEGLSSADPDLRWASARALARLALSSEPAQAVLVGLARSGEKPVARRMALYSLRYLGSRGEEILSVAEGAARSHAKLVRLAALTLLAELNDCSGRAARVAIGLLESDPDPGVRRAAAAALGKLGNRSAKALETLARTAADPDRALARAAGRALRRLGYNGNARS